MLGGDLDRRTKEGSGLKGSVSVTGPPMPTFESTAVLVPKAI